MTETVPHAIRPLAWPSEFLKPTSGLAPQHLRRACMGIFLVVATSVVATTAVGSDRGGTLDLASYAADPSPLETTAAGFSASGMLQVVAEGLAQMVRRSYPGSSFVYEPGGPAGGIVRLARGERPFAIQTGTDLSLALAGSPPFRDAYAPASFLPVARIAEGFIVQVYAREEFLQRYGVNDLSDVARQRIPMRVSTNPRGNTVSQAMAHLILDHYGMDYERIESWGGEIIYLPTRASNDLMRNRKLDVVITAGFAPSSALSELAVGTPIRMLSLPPQLTERLVNELGMEPSMLPAGTYSFVTEDMPLPAAYFLLTAGPHTYGGDVYKVLRSLHDQFDYYRMLHPRFAELDRSMLAMTGPLARHPVAEAFFRDTGLVNGSDN